jgi:hypothetical protein
MMRVGMAEWVIVIGIVKIAFLVLVAIVAAVVILLVRGGRVACPHCAERIRKEAIVCRFCGREVMPAAPASVSSAGGPDPTA